jgi:hypothetical protein
MAYVLERNLFNEGRTVLLLDGAANPSICENTAQLAALCSSISSQGFIAIVYLAGDDLASTLVLNLNEEQLTYLAANQPLDEQRLRSII